MRAPAASDLRRWSEEVARDPASLAFLPLARAYRRMGHRSAALQLCLRGLEHYPTHADAHSLLALLHLESGDRRRAAEEWSTVLRLDPNHFEALRGQGFCYLEQDQLSRARETLERAAILRPGDTAVQEALRLLGTRQELQKPAPSPLEYGDDPWAMPPEPPPAPAGGTAVAGAPPTALAGLPEEIVALSAPVHQADGRTVLGGDPARLFATISEVGPVFGALLLDERGLVLAGSLHGGVGDRAEALSAILGGAIAEASRMAGQLALGEWHGMLLECEGALLHLAPVGRSAIVLLAAERTAPVGWVLRTAAQAGEMATRYLEVYG
ncbi:MAG: tetratricopeptide repeat protein [Gemmatimonadetes bacterium]|nr:tetratricopeptide repeat protein [Gemmatimonadota bacterium]